MEKGFTINVLDKGYVRYVDHMGSDRRIVESARVSYGSTNKTEEEDKKLLAYLYKNRHTSPFEMCKITLDFKMPIFVSRQYIRHRMQSVNEFSMRYKEAPEEFYIPEKWRQQDTKNKQGSIATEVFDPRIATAFPITDIDDSKFYSHTPETILEQHCRNCFFLYSQMIDAGIAREMARMVLPLNIYTYFYATWDLKNLLHFITLREETHAQAEIQEYGKAIKVILQELFPWTMVCYEKYKLECYEKYKFTLNEISPK